MQVNSLNQIKPAQKNKAKTNNIAFKGNKSNAVDKFLCALDKVKDPQKNKLLNYIDLKGTNITLPVYSCLLMIVVIGTRYFQSRGEDEKREIITRDGIGLATYLFSLPFFKRLAAQGIEKKTGFVTSLKKNIVDFKKEQKEEKNIFKKIKNYVMPQSGFHLMTNYDIENTYTKKDSMTKFAQDLTTNTSKDGKQINKILKFAIGEEKVKKLGIPEKNEDIIKWFKKAESNKTNAPIKKGLQEIKEAFKPGGKILERAKFLKEMPDAAALLFVVSLLGFLLPWLNIKVTREKYLHDSQGATNNQTPTVQNNQKTNITENQKRIFSQFIK